MSLENMFELESSCEKYWGNNSGEALETVLETYENRDFESQEVHEILEDYFTEKYGPDPDYRDLDSDIEREAFDIYTLTSLTDLTLDKIEYDNLFGFN